MRNLTDADVAALAPIVAAEVVRLLGSGDAASRAAAVCAKPRLSARAAAKLLGIQPATFRRRYVAKGFIHAGSDKCFARREVMRLREGGE